MDEEVEGKTLMGGATADIMGTRASPVSCSSAKVAGRSAMVGSNLILKCDSILFALINLLSLLRGIYMKVIPRNSTGFTSQ